MLRMIGFSSFNMIINELLKGGQNKINITDFPVCFSVSAFFLSFTSSEVALSQVDESFDAFEGSGAAAAGVDVCCCCVSALSMLNPNTSIIALQLKLEGLYVYSWCGAAPSPASSLRLRLFSLKRNISDSEENLTKR